MLVADALSRAYLPGDGTTEFNEDVLALADHAQQETLRMVASQATIEVINKAAVADDQYQLLRHQISIGWPAATADIPTDLEEFVTFVDELIEADELVFKGQRVVVPHEARTVILQRIHSSHIGVNGCIRRAREAVFYPVLTADIKKTVAGCAVCEAFQSSMIREPLMSHVVASCPWEKIVVDVSTCHNQDYLITVCYLSEFFEMNRLPSKKASDVIYSLIAHMARHDRCMELCSDNSPFNSAEFRRFAEAYDFKHTTSSPHYPQSNERAEQAVKVCKLNRFSPS